ncbi:hypothetical protein GDO86_011239 [Hymenochirus boettgeri]|uniref:Uncharacterized protein n=1 Tax=Hymenochirus boettgeri TaxID=247094 RepID=A0A8T2JIS0_9PIPI|nr:hypothetical protein GDO86_011239 [Hymenochirus boettgeri]
MPLQNIKVANEGTVNFQKVKEDCTAAVDALHKVVACYRHLAITVGGSSDSACLRDELRRAGERAQLLAISNRNKLTAALRDKQISKKDREELERLWVQFSSCLELFHNDMCKVFELGMAVTLSANHKLAIQTGVTGPTSAIASRALSAQNMNYSDSPANKTNEEYKEIEDEILKVDNMITDMEMKVNVLRWTVEANSRINEELDSTNDESSVALLSMEEGNSQQCCSNRQLILSFLVGGIALVAITLSSVL